MQFARHRREDQFFARHGLLQLARERTKVSRPVPRRVDVSQVRRNQLVPERALIERVLQQTRWNRKEAAEKLQISYKALLYKMKENGLSEGR